MAKPKVELNPRAVGLWVDGLEIGDITFVGDDDAYVMFLDNLELSLDDLKAIVKEMEKAIG